MQTERENKLKERQNIMSFIQKKKKKRKKLDNFCHTTVGVQRYEPSKARTVAILSAVWALSGTVGTFRGGPKISVEENLQSETK